MKCSPKLIIVGLNVRLPIANLAHDAAEIFLKGLVAKVDDLVTRRAVVLAVI